MPNDTTKSFAEKLSIFSHKKTRKSCPENKALQGRTKKKGPWKFKGKETILFNKEHFCFVTSYTDKSQIMKVRIVLDGFRELNFQYNSVKSTIYQCTSTGHLPVDVHYSATVNYCYELVPNSTDII